VPENIIAQTSLNSIKLMLKKCCLFLFSIYISLSSAQNSSKEFRLEWNSGAMESANAQIPTLQFKDAVYNGVYGVLPCVRYEMEIDKNVKALKIELSNEQSNLIPIAKLEQLHPAFQTLSEFVELNIRYKNLADKNLAIIEFVPIKYNVILNSLEFLTSFSMEITPIQETEKNIEKEAEFSTESVMNSGEWYKFKVDKSGVFKISGADLQTAGLSMANLDSRRIAVYGFGGMLKEKNSDFRFADIPELAIQMVDGNDGRFDAVDYLLFYAQGPDTWQFNANKNVFEHQLNVYDRNAYYFVHIKTLDGKRIETIPLTTEVANKQITSFTNYAFVEDETYNLIGSGRRWFGFKFEFTDNTKYNFNFANLISGSQAYLKAKLIARSSASSSFDLFYNSTSLGNIRISSIPTGSYPAYAYDNTFEKYFSLSADPNMEVKLLYNRPLSGSIGWLDYIELNVQEHLKFGNAQLLFRSPESVGSDAISKFSVSNASSATLVWDVSQLEKVQKIQTQLQVSTAEFTIPTNELKEFIAFTPEMAFKPTFVEKMGNQDLHSIANIDMIIVCPPLFLPQANELADFHRQDGLKVQVNTTAQIYNEYSSGKQDPTAIRDFVRSVYQHSSALSPLQYLLLFGDASYDYLNRETNNTNLIPTFESIESLDPIISIAVDDYFGFLDEDEGDMYYDDVDIGIGRLPVVNEQEASAAVAKIKHYSNSSSDVFGNWRTVVCFVADDEDNNLHIQQANELAMMVDTIYPSGNLDKIYVDAYQQVSTPAGQRYPKVNEAINDRIEKGTLILSYTGHGGETGWGQERYLDMPDIATWANKDKLAVFLTATCEFARYDNPKQVSAGEYIFLKENGGGIALFTTSRATYAGSNFVMSKYFYQFTLDPTHRNQYRMGDILKLTKRASGSGFNVMKFILIGDPALKLSIPENSVRLTQINNMDVSAENDTLKALSLMRFQGQVEDKNGLLMSDFDGFVFPQIFDKVAQITTLANDAASYPYNFDLQKNVIYKGKSEIKNGLFDFSFVVPKDIAYRFGNGKISLYAANNEEDAGGFTKDIVIGGYDETSETDIIGPVVRLFLNDINFVEGGMSHENPVLLAKVSDENGINTIGNGIGHDITAFLDENGTDIKILNDYYESDLNTYKSGTIRYPFSNLAEGPHEINFKVWDIYNNSSVAKLSFYVSVSAVLALDALMNYPNPFSDETVFSFEHNINSQSMSLSIDIYSLDGRLVKHLEDNFEPYSSRINHIRWDGTDDNGSKISKGMYVYRLQISDQSGNTMAKTAKLVYLK
jgi:hypothetical protein